jgi:hypothetical protein
MGRNCAEATVGWCATHRICRGCCGCPDTPVFTVFMNGDVNGDGIVDINDALEILKYLASLPHEIKFPPGSTLRPTINDALEILKKLANLPNDIV